MLIEIVRAGVSYLQVVQISPPSVGHQARQVVAALRQERLDAGPPLDALDAAYRGYLDQTARRLEQPDSVDDRAFLLSSAALRVEIELAEMEARRAADSHAVAEQRAAALPPIPDATPVAP